MARGSSKVVDKDRGFRQRVRQILSLKPTSVTVGIHADAGAGRHDRKAAKAAAHKEKQAIAAHAIGLGVRALGGGTVNKSERISQKTASARVKAAKANASANSLTVLDVGTIHEFGLGNVPERSFIRGWADENKEKNAKTISLLMRSVAQGKRTAEDAANIIGLRFVGEIQRRMRDRIPPPLKPATIARKGSDVPLIDTGQLRSSIQYKVGYRV